MMVRMSLKTSSLLLPYFAVNFAISASMIAKCLRTCLGGLPGFALYTNKIQKEMILDNIGLVIGELLLYLDHLESTISRSL